MFDLAILAVMLVCTIGTGNADEGCGNQWKELLEHDNVSVSAHKINDIDPTLIFGYCNAGKKYVDCMRETIQNTTFTSCSKFALLCRNETAYYSDKTDDGCVPIDIEECDKKRLEMEKFNGNISQVSLYPGEKLNDKVREKFPGLRPVYCKWGALWIDCMRKENPKLTFERNTTFAELCPEDTSYIERSGLKPNGDRENTANSATVNIVTLMCLAAIIVVATNV